MIHGGFLILASWIGLIELKPWVLLFDNSIVAPVIAIDLVLLQKTHQQGFLTAVRDDFSGDAPYSFCAQHLLKLFVPPTENLLCRVHNPAPCQLAVRATNLRCQAYIHMQQTYYIVLDCIKTDDGVQTIDSMYTSAWKWHSHRTAQPYPAPLVATLGKEELWKCACGGLGGEEVDVGAIVPASKGA